jgi:L-fuconolactonase
LDDPPNVAVVNPERGTRRTGRTVVCDAQVHAPHVATQAGGIDPDDLVREMDGAGVDRSIIVPLPDRGPDESVHNEAALAIARGNPARFRVMGTFDLTKRANRAFLADWTTPDAMLGARVAFVRDPNLSLLIGDELGWFWSGAEAADVPVMLFAPGMTQAIRTIAQRHPDLRLIVDHFNLPPRVTYDRHELAAAVTELGMLAAHDNVAIKASALPCSVAETFPFPSLHGAIRRAIDLFGPARVFWGSDLTRLPCRYIDCVRLFTDELPLSADEKDWILGRGIMEWLGWTIEIA